MKYFLDTEFIEYPCTIDLISIGIVSEDGREFYAVSSEFDESKASAWVKENVLKHLYNVKRISKKEIADQILGFIKDDPSPEFWAYYADYDWVVFMWLYGTMMEKPKHFPYFCNDIKQLANSLGDPELPTQKMLKHDALNDARWNKQIYNFLIKLRQSKT
jgi:hypothetical protein